MDWDTWLTEVAETLNVEPEELVEAYSQLRPLLYDAGASPGEAADFIRAGG